MDWVAVSQVFVIFKISVVLDCTSFNNEVWLVGWLGFTACQPTGLFYAEYVFIYELTFFL